MSLPSLWSVVSLFAAAVVAPVVLAAQKPQYIKLGRLDVEFTESFDDIQSVRELRDGRVIVSDLTAKTVSLVDLTHGTATALGHEGQGPKEFNVPDGLIALPGDTTLVIDLRQRRFLRLNPDGTPLDVVRFLPGSPRPDGMRCGPTSRATST